MSRKNASIPPSHSGTPNWSDQTIWTADNLHVMRGMNSNCVDLIYLDPPFNSNANYAAPIGSQAAGAEFRDIWGLNDIDLVWHGEIKHDRPGLYELLQCAKTIHGDSMMSYLIYMAIRILEMHRILKETGSIYLHCDPTASHYLKLLMDSIFGKENFRNEIVWSYRRWPSKHENFQRMHDVILRYSKSDSATWNQLFEPLAPSTQKAFGGKKLVTTITSKGTKNVSPTSSKSSGTSMRSVWHDISIVHGQSKENTRFPTQKPLALLRRIIEASSNPKDIILDPFCGCATACVAASMLDRQWAGIDISPKAAELVQIRLAKELPLLTQNVTHRTDIPTRTDLGKIPKYNSTENKNALYGEQSGYCNGCGTHFEKQHLTFDHIVARTTGGTDHIGNLQLLCGSCNSIKGTKTHEELLLRLTDKGFMRRRQAGLAVASTP